MAFPFGEYRQEQAPGNPMGLRSNEHMGLAQSGAYRYEPPAQMAQQAPRNPVDFLAPGSKQHEFVLNYLLRRLNWSEQKMSQFYPRWQASELRMQGYVTSNDFEGMLRSASDGTVPTPKTIVVPYSFAAIGTITSYMLQAFGGRKPMFTVGAYRGEQVQRARNMETLLQYNADYTKYIHHLYQFIQNGEIYGLAIQRNAWRRETRKKTVFVPPDPYVAQIASQWGPALQPTRQQQEVVAFEGNNVAIVSPFMFFPDPRVPMVECATRGEFVFWRSFDGLHHLLREEAAGRIKWVRYANKSVANPWGSSSQAGIRALGESLTDGGTAQIWGGVSNNYQVDQGSVEIIPAELGLGESRAPEKWIFTILNKSQIVQAEPLNVNHGHHPVSVAEPNAFGHSFGQLGTADLVGPMQDLMTWLINSHMFNVRASLNNMLVVDPSKVEMDDLLDPEPGALIRLKSTPWGQIKPTDAVHQLQVGDVTRGHVGDFQLFNRIANDLTGASDNIRGLQEAGGRKTATEVRTTFEAGGSRLASRARVYSAQAIAPSSEQWASNYQQFLSMEFEARVLGQDGQMHSVRISPEEIEGDFFFPINDGTLPMDKVAILDVWQKIMETVITEPTGVLRSQYRIDKMFEFVAQLSGAQNMAEFRVAGPEAMQQQEQRGNIVPLGALPGMLGQMPGPPPGGMASAEMMRAA